MAISIVPVNMAISIVPVNPVAPLEMETSSLISHGLPADSFAVTGVRPERQAAHQQLGTRARI
jgi:hypothetical protein